MSFIYYYSTIMDYNEIERVVLDDDIQDYIANNPDSPEAIEALIQESVDYINKRANKLPRFIDSN